jgi:hypothetical protein
LHVTRELHRIETATGAKERHTGHGGRGRGHCRREDRCRIFAIAGEAERPHLTITTVTGEILRGERSGGQQHTVRNGGREEMDE